MHHLSTFSSVPLHRHSRSGSHSLQQRDSNQRDLDGSWDPTPTLNGLSDSWMTTTMHPGLSEGRSFSERGSDNYRQIPAIISTSPGTRSVAELLQMPGPSPEMYATEPSTSIYSRLPHQFDRVCRRSSIFPRSPLYISYLAASSSPEKRPRPISEMSERDVSAELELLSISSRQRKRYRRRSQSYPYLASEADSLWNGYRENESTPIISSPRTSQIPSAGASGTNHPHSSPPTLGPGSRQIAEGSPMNISSSASNSAARASSAVVDRQFTPLYQSPYGLPLTIPPHPFSAVRRAVSFTPALPSSSSSPRPAPYDSPLYSNSAHSHPSVTAPPGHPAIPSMTTVYPPHRSPRRRPAYPLTVYIEVVFRPWREERLPHRRASQGAIDLVFREMGTMGVQVATVVE